MSQYALGVTLEHRYFPQHSHNPVLQSSSHYCEQKNNQPQIQVICLIFIQINYKVATRHGQYNLMENDFLRCRNFTNNKTSNLAKQLHLNNKLSDCKQLWLVTGTNCQCHILAKGYTFFWLIHLRSRENTGGITFGDFMNFLSTLSKGTLQEKIYWSFRFYDVNKDGIISRDEMMKVRHGHIQTYWFSSSNQVRFITPR